LPGSSFSAPHLDLWERVIDYPEVRKTNGVRLADWDLDGDLDIIVADRLKTWAPWLATSQEGKRWRFDVQSPDFSHRI
jgi:hypothetical protein